ncbi:MAG TPA: tetratricopeptide repeat protein [Verrucomicrobiae bacterium]|nr:tetratricopeptide repeat protein [Verrucomicrobiae bacterium]
MNTTGKIGRNGILLVCAVTFTFGSHQASGMQFTGTPLRTIRAAAQAGDVAAQDTLATVFIERGNFLAAELWYRDAAKQGQALAQVRLGEMLLAHAGLTAQVARESAMAMASEAIKWLTLAANGGDTLAQAELAGIYLSGQSVKADLLEAYKWGDIAAKAPQSIPGSIAGESLRNTAALKMSIDQIAQAKQRVATFYSHVPSTPNGPGNQAERHG